MVSPEPRAVPIRLSDFSEFDGKTIAVVFNARKRHVYSGVASFEVDAKQGNLLRIKDYEDVAEVVICEQQWQGQILRGRRYGYDCDFCFVVGPSFARG